MKILTVTNPFGGYAKGDAITDPATIQAILQGEHAAHVVASERPDLPKSKKSPATE